MRERRTVLPRPIQTTFDAHYATGLRCSPPRRPRCARGNRSSDWVYRGRARWVRTQDSVQLAKGGIRPVLGPASGRSALFGPGSCLRRAHSVEAARTVVWGDNPMQTLTLHQGAKGCDRQGEQGGARDGRDELQGWDTLTDKGTWAGRRRKGEVSGTRQA